MKPRAVHALVLAVLLAAACNRKEEEAKKTERAKPAPSASASGAHADEAEHEELPTRVRLDPAVVAAAKIRAQPVGREVLASTVDLPGEVAPNPDKTAKVSTLLPGRIDAVNFREGQAVTKGDVLVVIKVPEIGKARAAFAATSVKAAAARSNADRLQVLADKRLAASQDVLSAKAEAEALEAETKAAGEQLAALGTGASATGSELALRAPVSGIVVARDAVVGEPVGDQRTLATIADLGEVWFLGRVFEKNLAQVHVGAPAEVELNAYPGERFAGRIDYLGKQIDPTARTVVARIGLTNRADLLRIGLFGVAHVRTEEEAKKAPVLVVPRSSVTEIGQKKVVFVLEPDGDFEVHQVVLGEAALGKVEVVSGLREGEQAVVDGVFNLKSALLKGTFGESE